MDLSAVSGWEHLVQSIEVVMEERGLEIRGPLGNRLFGGHSCLVAGARYMAEIGIDLLTTNAKQVDDKGADITEIKNIVAGLTEDLRKTVLRPKGSVQHAFWTYVCHGSQLWPDLELLCHSVPLGIW